MAVTAKRCACHACVLDDISEIEELLAEDLMARDPDFKLSLKHPAEKAFMLLSMLEHRITRSNKLYYRPDEDDDFKVRPKDVSAAAMTACLWPK